MQGQAKFVSDVEVIGIRSLLKGDLWLIPTSVIATVAVPTVITKEVQNGLRSDNQYWLTGNKFSIQVDHFHVGRSRLSFFPSINSVPWNEHPSLKVDFLSDDFERFLGSVPVHFLQSATPVAIGYRLESELLGLHNLAPTPTQADGDSTLVLAILCSIHYFRPYRLPQILPTAQLYSQACSPTLIKGCSLSNLAALDRDIWPIGYSNHH